jgi:tRNA threonylcarbamoyladenosine biosynthesis protein TsaB
MAAAILALELSGDPSSVALAVQDGPATHTWEINIPGGRGRSLLPEIEQLLLRAKLDNSELAAILTGVGPGSYTGLRIACTAARTLALALGIPCAGVNSFEAAALSAPIGSTLHIFQDAYRQQAYHAIYRRPDAEHLQIVQEAKVISIDDLPQTLDSDCAVLCDQRLQQALAAFDPAPLQPTAEQILQSAFQAGLQLDGTGIEYLIPAVPLYLRAAAFRSA